MSFVSAFFPSDPPRQDWESEGENRLVKQLCSASEFLRGLRVQMRFGKLTRAPLRLLRLQMLDDVVECDWQARLTDPWDADLPQNIRRRHAALQTLRDAMDVRALLFATLPQVKTAHFRVYRISANHLREMVVTGCSQRSDDTFGYVHSLAMRAKSLGFRFHLENDALHSISG